MTAEAIRPRGGQFVTTVWRDWLTASALDALGLNERQRAVVRLVRDRGRIGNLEYQGAFGVSKPTASRDLEQLREIRVLVKVVVTRPLSSPLGIRCLESERPGHPPRPSTVRRTGHRGGLTRSRV